MNNKAIITFFILITLGCDPVDDKLIVNNSTNNTIYYVISRYEKLASLYSEDAENAGYKRTYLNYIHEIQPKSKENQILTGGGNAWERYIDNVCEDSKLHVYTFHMDTLKKYTWKEVITDNHYIKKMEFSVQDLNSNNWEIKF